LAAGQKHQADQGQPTHLSTPSPAALSQAGQGRTGTDPGRGPMPSYARALPGAWGLPKKKWKSTRFTIGWGPHRLHNRRSLKRLSNDQVALRRLNHLIGLAGRLRAAQVFHEPRPQNEPGQPCQDAQVKRGMGAADEKKEIAFRAAGTERDAGRGA